MIYGIRLFLLLCTVVGIQAAVTFPTLAIGAQAPNFSLPGADGNNHTLAAYASAKVLVIVFTCNHCPTAQAYEDRIQAIVNDYAGKSLQLIAINPNHNKNLRPDELGYTDLADSLPEMKLRVADKKYTYPYLDDGETQAVAMQYGPRVTPHTFVFDAERKLRYDGRIDDSERLSLATTKDLRDAIDAVLADKEVAVPHTKVAGCSTKWNGKEADVKEAIAKLDAEPVTLELADATALTAIRANATERLRIVTVWNTTCAPCVRELSEFVTLNRQYRKRGFDVITISTNYPDEKEAALKVLVEHKVATTNVLFASTEKFKLMEAFDPQWEGETPYTLLIAPGGKVLNRWIGTIESLEVKRAIVAQLGRVYGK